MKNIILIAPPAAGKGTEAEILETEYSIPHIATGDLLRQEVKKGTKFADEISRTMSSGNFVSDEIILQLIKERINKQDCQNGYILDGFPRDLVQAQKYDKLLGKDHRDIGYVFVINMDKEIAKSRITGRRTCPKCGRVYNLNCKALTPKKNNICDNCSSQLLHREDDNAETYDKRYDSYIEKTAPLIDYYKNKNVVYYIDGNIDKDNTHSQIDNILKEND